MIEPLNYVPFVYLMDQSYPIITDSGGIQEKAPSLGKPVLVMRGSTERPKALASRMFKLVGTDAGMMLRETSLVLNNVDAYQNMAMAHNP